MPKKILIRIIKNKEISIAEKKITIVNNEQNYNRFFVESVGDDVNPIITKDSEIILFSNACLVAWPEADNLALIAEQDIWAVKTTKV